MKKILFLIMFGIIISCSTVRQSSSVQEDQILITRRYIGDFIDYSHTGPNVVGGIDLIWIKTTVYNTFGQISAYSKSCDFSVGDKIYLRPTPPSGGNYGKWVYEIENDSSIKYIVSEFRFENNIFVRSATL